MSNGLIGDTREISSTLDGSQGVIDSQEQYKRNIKNRFFKNEPLKFLGTGDTNGTQTQLQITRSDLNDNNGNPGFFDRANRQMMFLIFRRLRHTTNTGVNLVLSCANASNTAINDTDNHYAKASIEFRSANTSGYRESEDASRYSATFSLSSVFKTDNANHTGAGTWDITSLGEQHRNLAVHGHFVYYGTYFSARLGSFNFDHLDDNSDDLPAYFNLAAYTGNAAHKLGDYYGYPEPDAIIMS